MKTYQHHTYPFTAPVELQGQQTTRHPVIVVGAGPVGLSLALDLAQKGTPVIILDDNNQVSNGSRAICFAKRSLEIFDRLGAVQPMRSKGLTWNTGRVFYRDKEIYRFNLLPEEGHHHPAFINLQQYYAEEYLLDKLQHEPCADIRLLSKVIAIEHLPEGERLTIATPEGQYSIDAAYVLACDGSNSTLRNLLGLEYIGKDYEEKFLIADIVMKSEQPLERWFWFDPAFAPGQSVLLHRQPDNMLRIDFRLGKQADAATELQPEYIMARIRSMLGDDVAFDLEWSSVYTFQSRRLEHFVHGRTIFAGDAAHLVSPFGARGANSGIQDADNLAWKLHLVLEGKAPAGLLQSYDAERVQAAAGHLEDTENSTAFIAPLPGAALDYRNALLELAATMPQVRPLINSGRLSTPSVYTGSPLNTPDTDVFSSSMLPGTACADAPVLADGRQDWLLHFLGNDFTLLYYTGTEGAIPDPGDMTSWPVPVRLIIVTSNHTPVAGVQILQDENGYLKGRYDLQPGTCYLVRPDQYVAARWRQFDKSNVYQALCRACMLQVLEEKTVVAATEQAITTGAILPAAHDRFFRQFCELHQGLNAAESAALNSKLIVLLANELGDATRLEAILKILAGK